MSDEVGDLRVQVLKQGLALEGLQRAAADAEERRRSNHVEILEMMVFVVCGSVILVYGYWGFHQL